MKEETCPGCGKIIYPNRKEGLKAYLLIHDYEQAKGNGKHRKLSLYWCEAGKCFHIGHATGMSNRTRQSLLAEARRETFRFE